MADDHETASREEDLAASEPLYNVEGNRCRTHIYQGRDKLDEESIVDRAETLEEDYAKVEDEVDTLEKQSVLPMVKRIDTHRKLLHHLHDDTDPRAAAVRVALED